MERKILTTVKNLLIVKQSKCKLSKVKLPQNMQKQLFTVTIISVSARMFVLGGGGYSLYSDDRGCNWRFSRF